MTIYNNYYTAPKTGVQVNAPLQAKNLGSSLFRVGRWMIGMMDNDPLARGSSLLEEVADWRALLKIEPCESTDVRRHTRTGRPLGSNTFLEHLEVVTGRALRTRKAGKKPKK